MRDLDEDYFPCSSRQRSFVVDDVFLTEDSHNRGCD